MNNYITDETLKLAVDNFVTGRFSLWRALFLFLSESEFRRSVRNYTRGLYWSLLDYQTWETSMHGAISRGITRAWYEGAAEVGISKDELTDEEISELARFISNQLLYLPGFGQAIIEARNRVLDSAIDKGETPHEYIQNSEEGKRVLSGLLYRADMWAQRYSEARSLAMTFGRNDPKLRWDLGIAEHCTTCIKLSGKVKRASYWRAHGVAPKMAELECGGYNCQCKFTPTDEPSSKGPLPSIP